MGTHSTRIQSAEDIKLTLVVGNAPHDERQWAVYDSTTRRTGNVKNGRSIGQ